MERIHSLYLFDPDVNAGTYFQKRLQIPYFQLVANFDGVEAHPNQQYVIAAWRLLSLVG